MTYRSNEKQKSSGENRQGQFSKDNKTQWKKECVFCKEDSNPDFRDHLRLKRFVSERGKILPRSRSGVCSKHQKVLATAIKQARQLALIPYTNSI